MALNQFFIKQGDRLPAIEATLKDGKNVVVNLTDATVKLAYRAISSAVVIERTAEVVSAVAGTVRYQWVDGDTTQLVPGSYVAEWLAEFSGGRKMRFPTDAYIMIRVSPALSS